MALSGSTPAPSWEEDECLDYYGMLSLHRMFEVVGGQLTERELDLLAFLLDEAPGAAGGLSNARSGLELLLELERRGQCDESNLRLLGQLLRVLARHDLLPHLARKRRRPVSPERYNYGTSSSSTKRSEGSCRRRRQSSSSSDVQQDQWETGSLPTKRQRRSRGRPSGGARRRRRGGPAASRQQQEQARPASEGKVTCGNLDPRCYLWLSAERPCLPPPGCGLCIGFPRHPAQGASRVLRTWASLGAGCGISAAPGTGTAAGRVRAGHGSAALPRPGLRGV
ncbi:DNA-binding death effector domain-containing protein 2 isoform X2 [Phyllostomus hastatus]|uniref:DNA-binding death effector domain-containing protein 2 isoform X2 n=1 Tax=Phyllostomus hastatus TaxID=9423 RepID=UPI001E681164|nr:DNA-binding death effector domain-containing protein 2 isoform X2 [Phyllostomus hastatus]